MDKTNVGYAASRSHAVWTSFTTRYSTICVTPIPTILHLKTSRSFRIYLLPIRLVAPSLGNLLAVRQYQHTATHLIVTDVIR
jgi:hypothetical protein